MSLNGSSTVDYSGKNLNEKDMKQSIRSLLKLIQDDEKLKHLRTDEPYLLRYLQSVDFNVPEAFKKMSDYRDLMIEYPDWFATTSPLENKKQIEVGDKVLFKERDNQGRAVLLVKLGKMDVANSCPMEQSQIFDIWLESFMDDPEVQAAGLSAVVDMSGFSWKLFKWFTPTTIKLIVRKIDTYPFKDMLLHVVNTNFLVTALIKLIWPFLNERLKNMFKFHFDNYSALHEYISPEILPPEYGGTGPEIDHDKIHQVLFDKNTEIARKLQYQRVS